MYLFSVHPKILLWTKFPFFFAAEKELLESLPLSKQCPTEDEASLVKYLYENKLKKVCILSRVPTRPGKPGKMRVHLENLEISWNFEKFNKYHGNMA